MRTSLFLFTICILLISCKKSNETLPESINTDFNIKRLDGYFITSIAFDKQGNTWIGNFKQGLIKYNSSTVTIYNSNNSIISDTSVIYDIAIDSKNNVWISCEGLIKYDGINFKHFNSSNTTIPENFVSSIAIDSEDNIWLSSSRFRQRGIVKYNGVYWTVYTPNNSDLPLSFVRSIAIDKHDNVWLTLNEIVNNSYLVKISNDNWTIYTNSDLGFTPYYFGNIQINSKNKICGAIDYSLSSMMTNNGPQVFIFDGITSEKLQYDNTSDIQFITVDNKDNIWCGTYDGFVIFNGEKWTIEKSRFKNDGVFSIEQSYDNKIWIGTGNGIYIND